jgi:RNA polymerase sigma-70 factor (ECF subfamily)
MLNQLHYEKKLFAQIAEEDENAFRELYNGYFQRLSLYIFKFCKSTNATEDVLQEVFMKLWSSRALLIQVEIPEAFILAVARNTTVDWLRKLSKQTTLIEDLKSQLQENDNDAENKMSVDSLESLIAAALQQLSPQKQKVFQLSKIVGLTHDEIAQELQLSKSTVKNHLSETLNYIKKQILPGISSKNVLFLMWLSSILR